MEVLRSNYLKVLPEILGKLENAAFVSFDAEFTGLKYPEGEETSLFDNSSERYKKLRKVVLNNSAPQFGISIFQRQDGNAKEQYYSIDAYSFHLCEPCFADFNMTRPKFRVDMDCIQFLREIKFDFNKLFQHAVPYLNKARTAELVQYLEENPDFMSHEKDGNNDLDEVYFPVKMPMLSEIEKENIVRRLRGFSLIVDVISNLKIPVVGHNMALDLMYFFQKFCSELPERYEDFKTQVFEFLPVIFDTKYMTVRCRKMLDHPTLLGHTKDDIAQLRCSGLYVIYKTSSAVVDKFSPKFALSENCKHFEKDLERGKLEDLEESKAASLCHEPAFDATATGIVFLNIAHIAGRMSKDFLEDNTAPSLKKVFFCVNHWMNQIFIARATIMTMCLRGDDPRPVGSWIKVTSKEPDSDDVNKINAGELMARLRNEAKLKFSGVDYKQVSPTEVLFAVARAQCSRDLLAQLTGMGYEATKMFIPWDKKRHAAADDCKQDEFYDTRRNQFYS